MRTLLLFRGAPGCGKSTFIKENGLEPYAVSADKIRMLYSSPSLNVNGEVEINQTKDKYVWDTLYSILDSRMNNGDFTVVDATNSKTEEMNRIKNIAKTYKYRVFIIDMTDLPIDECKRRNKMRPQLQQVPDSVIDKMYARFATQKIPAGITVLSTNPDDENFWLDRILFKPISLDSYDEVHIIGDIHGCYTALNEYINGDLKDNICYIFCGDFLDRGIENVEVLNFMLSIMEKPNVLLIEGNHERHLYNWAHDGASKGKDFEKRTKYELFKAGIDKKQVRIFYRHLQQCAWFKFDNRHYFVSHGGISKIPYDSKVLLLSVQTSQMIKGVGRYQDVDKVMESWEHLTTEYDYQVFGHRNVLKTPTDAGHRCYCLEGDVEHGGYLRCLELKHNSEPKPVEIKNNVYRIEEDDSDGNFGKEIEKDMEVSDLIKNLRNSRLIQEKQFGDISSFNFTRSAFQRSAWNKFTTHARGLFINTKDFKVVARSYNKFFNMDEQSETKIDSLCDRLVFPMTAYVKENGFLGIISYNKEDDSLFIATKSSITGPCVDIMKDFLATHMSDAQLEQMKQITKCNNVSLIFEVVDPEKDPHIIKYSESQMFLLDVVKNQIKFEKYSFEEMCKIADLIGVPHKEKAYVFDNWNDFFKWSQEVTLDGYKYNGKDIEGFVLEDSVGFMFKLKLAYYHKWKHMRNVLYQVQKFGHLSRTGGLLEPIDNYFYGYCKEQYEKDENFKDKKISIIDFREKFLNEMNMRGIHFDEGLQ